MKVTLEFELWNEREDFDLALAGVGFHSALRSLDEKLRQIVKYGSEGVTEEQRACYEQVRTWLREELDEQELSLL